MRQLGQLRRVCIVAAHGATSHRPEVLSLDKCVCVVCRVRQADVWRPLALQRWESYLSAAAIIDADGEATRALMAARSSRQEQEPASSRGG